MSQHWETKKLKEIAQYSIGLTYSPKDVSINGVIVLRSSNIQNGKMDLGDLVRVNKVVKEELMVKEGDILMCARNGSKRLVGKTAYISNLSEEMTFGTFMMIIRSQANPFLFWFFNSDVFHKQIVGGKNTMIGQITRYMLDDVLVPVPPIPEQEGIIKILTESFAAIEKAKANIERNLQNAKDLFESYVNEVFKNKASNWTDTTLNESVDLLTGYPFKSKFYTHEANDIRLLRGDNIMQGYLRWEEAKRWLITECESYEKYQLKEGDVVLAMDRPWVKAGLKCARISRHDLPSLLVQRVARLRCNERINNAFLFYLIKSKEFTQHLIAAQTGIGVPHISANQILNFSFRLPPLKTQLKIVNHLELLARNFAKLTDGYRRKLNNLEELEKVIVQKAFSGELTVTTQTQTA